jgi:hypothetical protein
VGAGKIELVVPGMPPGRISARHLLSWYPKWRSDRPKYNPEWLNADHFSNCSNFEQTLLKMMTGGKRWSTNTGSGWS